MTPNFSEFDLQPPLLQTIADIGYAAPTAIQSTVIPAMLAGQDVIGQSQTGSGKTAAFSLPILHNLQTGQGHVQSLVEYISACDLSAITLLRRTGQKWKNLRENRQRRRIPHRIVPG